MVVLPNECFSFVADVASCRDQAVLVHPGLGRVWDQLVPKLESLSQGRQKRLLCPDSFGTTENTFSRAVRKYGDAGMIATMSEVFHFLRLLYVKLGVQHCPDCDVEIRPQTFHSKNGRR